MPNRCSNNLEITTNVEPEEFLINYENEYYLMFEKVVPLGEWEYDKAIQNWGTKWDIATYIEGIIYCDYGPVTIRNNYPDRTTYYLSYETAWSPPDQYLNSLYELLLKKDPDVYIRNSYYESGCGLLGIIENGTYYNSTYSAIRSESLESYVSDDKDEIELLSEFDTVCTTEQAKHDLNDLFKRGIIKRKELSEALKELE